MNKKFYLGLLLLGCILFTMNSCSDDDDLTQSEMLKELTENATDRIADGLYGNVKTVDVMYYDNATWSKSTIDKGSLARKQTITYSNAGYYQEIISYSPTSNYSSKMNIPKFDAKNRPLEKVYESYTYSDAGIATISSSYKYTYVYDDNAKEATATLIYSNDGINYFESSYKTVYKLKDNGRIDYDNYTDYYKIDESLRATTDVAPEYELIYKGDFIQEKDNQGNWTKQYNKYTDYYNETTSISNYAERTITYY